MSDLASLRATVHGHVQGVFFRAFVSRQAGLLGLKGFVRNLPDGRSVEVRAEGDREKLGRLVEHLKVGPPGASVEKVELEWADYSGRYPDFRIRY